MPESNKRVPFAYKFTAGAAAGVTELLFMYPLDVVKTRMQLQVTNVNGSKNINGEYRGLFDCFHKIIKTEGPRRLYKGISSPILMEAPKRATKFAANEELAGFYKNVLGYRELTQEVAVLSGASAGVFEGMVIVPFELVKIQLQDRNTKFKGPIDVIRSVVRNKGIRGMCTGLEATIWRQSVWNAGYFGVIFQVKSILASMRGSSDKPLSKTAQTQNDLLAGIIGGTVGVLLNTPFDVVKSRIQKTESSAATGPKKYVWAWPSICTVYREEGFKALYKGFVPKVVRLGPGGGIMLVVFNRVLEWCLG